MVPLIDWLSLRWLRWLGLRSRYVESSHGPLHVLDGPGRGDLPDLVLMHGLSSRSTHYRRFVPRLLPHFRRVIVPDLLAHGWSHYPDEGIDGPMVTDTLCEVVDELLDEPAVVFGNSLGGYAAMQFASRHPDKVRGLFVASPGGAVTPLENFKRMTGNWLVRTHEESVAFCRKLFAGPVPLEWLVAHVVRYQLNKDHIRQFIDRMGEHDFLGPEILERIAAPTRLYWGLQERLLADADLAYYREQLPHAEVCRPEGWGHSPFTERPDEVASELRVFAEALV